MTHSIDAPLPPPATTGGATTGTASPADHVGRPRRRPARRRPRTSRRTRPRTSARPPRRPAARSPSTATDQAKQVAQETQRQAKDLLDQGRTQVRDQAVTQQQKAAEGLTGLAQQLRGMADGTGAGAPGPAADLLQQASGIVERVRRTSCRTASPAELLDEVRSFARRKPGVFLLGAAAAGVVAGRLTSGVKAAHSGLAAPGTGQPAGYRHRLQLRRPGADVHRLRRGHRGDDRLVLRRRRHRHRRRRRSRRRRTAPCPPPAAWSRRPRPPAGTTRLAVPVGWADR